MKLRHASRKFQRYGPSGMALGLRAVLTTCHVRTAIPKKASLMAWTASTHRRHLLLHSNSASVDHCHPQFPVGPVGCCLIVTSLAVAFVFSWSPRDSALQ